MHAFISYQTEDKIVASRVKNILNDIGVPSFMAHEDINVSEEWRLKILDEIGKAEIFISLWSKHYYESSWCIQESGIASYRNNMTVIPLSLDGKIPVGFANNIQATKINRENITLNDLLPGVMRADPSLGIRILVKNLAGSRSFRTAELHFLELMPYINNLLPEQGKEILEASIKNSQVHHATSCATEYLPQVMSKFGYLLNINQQQFLNNIIAEYRE